MDDRNNSPEGGTAELSMDDAVSLLNANSDQEQSPEKTETVTPKDKVETEETEAEEAEEDEDDEDEGEAEEVDEDASEEDDDDDDDGVELDLDAIIEIDGERTTLKELREGAMRQSDFTRSKQQLAEEQKAIQAERQAIAEERARYAQALDQYEQRIQQDVEKEPDWDALFEDDPLEYIRLEKQWRDKKEARLRLETEREQVRQRQAVEQQRERQQYMEQGKAALLEKIPEWSDPQVAATEARQIAEFLLSQGYPPEAVQNVSPTDILFARQAMKAMKTTKSADIAKKKVQAKPKVIKAKSSKPQSAGKTTQRRKQLAKLERSGSIEDALPLLLS